MEHFKSIWESVVAKYLKKERLTYSYEPTSFRIIGKIKYTPDFVLKEASINGKKMILEPHGLMAPEHFKKFALFRRFFGQEYFLILIVKNDLIPLVPKDAYDDIWPIEFASLLAKRIKENVIEEQKRQLEGQITAY